MTETRAQTWDRLANESFDLLVIGGGVIGSSAARDAALRGMKVAVIEADDTASGTSSRSSKLVHGGLRYLEQGDFSLVFEAVSERRILLQIAPHLVSPMGFLFPIYPSSPVKLPTLRMGLMLYEGLALFRSPKLHRTLSSAQIATEVPLLSQDGLKGGPLYWDCMTDDARLTLETLLDARQQGAAVLTYGRVAGLVRNDQGRVCGVKVRDVLDQSETPREIEVRAAAVLNATGPWSDSIRSMGPQPSRQLRTTKGVHVVASASRFGAMQHVVVCTHPRDQRVLFVIPWGEQVYIGTTDTDYDGDPREVAADQADIDYLLEVINIYFPKVQLTHDDIFSTWAGLRPLIRTDGVAPSAVSREHVITIDPDGLISIAGGKLTTCRRMGGEVIDRALEWLKLIGHKVDGIKTVHTDQLPLPGAVGWPEDDDASRVSKLVAEASGGRLPEATCSYLANRYGTRAVDVAKLAAANQRLMQPLAPGRPEILAQVDWAVTEELAQTVTDFLERRTQLYFRDIDQGLGAVDAVAERMAELLGWSDAEKQCSADGYRAEVARSRRWRPTPTAQ